MNKKELQRSIRRIAVEMGKKYAQKLSLPAIKINNKQACAFSANCEHFVRYGVGCEYADQCEHYMQVNK